MTSKIESSGNNGLTQYSDWNPSETKFTELTQNKYIANQLISWPQNSAVIKLPEVSIDHHGVPNPTYCKVERDQALLKLPLYDNNPEHKVFIEKLQQLDKLYGSKKMMKKLFGKTKMRYIPTCRVHQDEEKPKYIKLKLALDGKTGKVLTQIYKKSEDPGDAPEQLKVETIKDYTDNVKYKSRVTVVIHVEKMWAHKPKQNDPQYGIGFKMAAIQVTGSSMNNTMPKISGDIFTSNLPMKTQKKATQEVLEDDSDESEEEDAPQQVEEDSDSSDSDSDSDESEESEKKLPPPKSKKKKKKVKNSSA